MAAGIIFEGAQIVLKVVSGVGFIKRHMTADDEAQLAAVRQKNNSCPHVLELNGGDDVFEKGLRQKELKQALRGTIFSTNQGWNSKYWHPDPFFKPANYCDWLVRSEWKGGGASSAAGIGYKDYVWKSSCNDTSGGWDTAGYCTICEKEAKERANQPPSS